MSEVIEKFEDLKTIKARVAFVKVKLADDQRWLTRGLLAIYEHQTRDEQLAAETKDHNGVGFSAFDATFLTAMAQHVMKGRTLSPKQLSAVRTAMIKYARQLVGIATKKH
jgi:hypothetical protein